MMSEEQIFTYLTSAGLAPHQAAGLMGSVAQESGFNPRAVNPKSKAVGLFQHLGPRKAALHDFARKSGRDPLAADTQLDFAINELNGPEAKARASLMSAPDVDSATLAFSRDFERAGKAERNDARRISKAREILDRMMQKYGMPALNAMIPAAQADEIPPPPPGFDADELPPIEASEIPPPPPGFDADELPPEPATPVQAIPPASAEVKDSPFSLSIGSVSEGMKLAAERQLVGAQQAGADIAKWVTGGMGTKDKSEYRQGLDADAAKLAQRSKDAPPMTKAGEVLLPLAETMVIPMPKTFPMRIAANAGIGAGLSFLNPTEEGEDMQDRVRRAGSAAITNAAMAGAMESGLGIAGGVRNMVSPRYGAARQMVRDAKRVGGSMGGDGAVPPVPPVPPDNSVPGARFTVGMLTDDSALLELEKIARTRNRDIFHPIDEHNRRAIHAALMDKAIPDEEATAMVDALNSETGPIREAAFEAIRQKLQDGAATFAEPLALEVDRVRTEPGLRVNDAAQVLAGKATKAMNPPRRDAINYPGRTTEGAPMAEQVGNEVAVKQGQPIDREVNVAKDDIVTAIRKLGGLNRENYVYSDGSAHWVVQGFGPHPIGPVWRGADKYGNRQGLDMSDMAERLKELGYLPPDARGVDLEDALFEAARGTLDDSRRFSAQRPDFSHLDGEMSAQDSTNLRLDNLIDLLTRREQRATAPKAEVIDEPPLPPDPKDLYNFKKALADSLNLKTLDADKFTNAVKSQRATTTSFMKAIDQGLDEASGGKWQEYLQAYKAGMLPIEEGRAVQDVLDVFASAPRLADNETPNITPAMFRRAIKEKGITYKNLGKAGWQDKVMPETRKLLNDVQIILDGMARAQAGARATTGSDTASNLAGMLKQGFSHIPGANKITHALDWADALGSSRQARQLDEALTDPARFQEVLDLYNRQKAGDSLTQPSLANLLKRAASRLPLSVYAGGR